MRKIAEDRSFATVIADGRFHMTVPEGTEGAKLRSYETSDGKKGEKWEMVYKEISGMISKVEFFEGDYGNNLQITIVDGDEEPIVVSLGTSTNFGEDMMKKLPGIDMSLPVRLIPYSFSDKETKKQKKGITVIQGEGDGVKVKNFFYDETKKVNLHGYPVPKKSAKPFSKDQWKLYFGECREFLTEYMTENFVNKGGSAEVENVDNGFSDTTFATKKPKSKK